MPRLVRADRLVWLVALAAPCALLAGCGPANDDGIKTYRVATHKGSGGGGGPVEPPPPVDQTPRERLLGAIIPVDADKSYFVLFKGPVEKIEPHEKDFDTFLNSVKVPGDGGKPISWTVPPGWKEAPARQFRVVTIQKDGSPELYISDPFGGSLLLNVNRWRTDHVGLPKIAEADLKTVTKEQKFGETTGYRVDFRGPGGKGGGMGKPPFAGGG
jgi:hypothetical protein